MTAASSRRRSALVLAACVAAVGVLYARTFSPHVLPGDPAELVTVVATQGLAHPTGYPLYVVAARAAALAAAFVPTAIAVNAFSTACSLAMLALVGASALALGMSRSAAALAVLLLATTRSVWRFSLHAEVYTFHGLLVAALLLALARARPETSLRRLGLAWYMAGAALGSHMTSVLLLPGLGLLALVAARSLPAAARWRASAGLAGRFVLGASCLAILFGLDRGDRLNYFDGIESLRPDLGAQAPVARVLHLVTAQQFQAASGFVSTLVSGRTLDHLRALFTALLADGAPLLFLGVPGLCLRLPAESRAGAPALRRWAVACRGFFALTVVAWSLYLSTYLRFFQPVFFLPAYAILAAGAANLLQRLACGRRLRPAVLAAAAAAVVWQAHAHFEHNDLGRESEYAHKSAALLAVFEPDAVVFSTWTYSTLFWFHQWVRGVNTGVQIVNAMPFEWEARSASFRGRPLYFERLPPGMQADACTRVGWFYRLREGAASKP